MAKREKPFYKGIEYDSQEEIWFVIWLEDAKREGYVIDWIYHPEEFKLFDRVADNEGKTLLRPHSYNPDFLVKFRPELWHKFPFCSLIYHAESKFRVEDGEITVREVFVDVKGKFRRGMMNTGAVTFPLNQRWVWQKYNIFINDVQPSSTKLKGKVTKKGFFAKTFVPATLAFNQNCKTLKRRKEYDDCRLLREDPTIFQE